jgi:hypothetical protein
MVEKDGIVLPFDWRWGLGTFKIQPDPDPTEKSMDASTD